MPWPCRWSGDIQIVTDVASIPELFAVDIIIYIAVYFDTYRNPIESKLDFPRKLVVPTDATGPHRVRAGRRFTETTIVAMRMESEPVEVPAPLVTAGIIANYVKKPVMFAGKVVSSTPNSVVLDGGDGGRQVTVARAMPPLVNIDQGMTIMVRGFVNEDNSIAESTTFPATILGDNFGKASYAIAFFQTMLFYSV